MQAANIFREDTQDKIRVNYQTRLTEFVEDHQDGDAQFGGEKIKIVQEQKVIETDKRVPRLGVMLVGLGGNNGSTFTAGILANKFQTTWESKRGT
jgi:myo-inositol-1-phosphate synthase